MYLEEKNILFITISKKRFSIFSSFYRMWWTITGTFGNILPIDWSKSYARKMHMPALNLNEAPVSQER